MRFNYLFSILLVLGSCCAAQETGVSVDGDKDSNWLSNPNFEFGLGTYIAIPLGGSFISNSTTNLGFELMANAVFKDQWIAGIGYDYFSLSDHDLSLTGYYGKSTITTWYFQLGYGYQFNSKLNSSLIYGAGPTKYENNIISSPKSFEDRGFHNSLKLNLDYALSESLSLKLHAGYRIDFMDIETPEEIDNLFENTQFITTSLSLLYSLDLH